MMRALVVLALGAVAGCRTEIKPLVKTEPRSVPREVVGECNVHDYASATEVPSGSTNVGWVTVPREESDDDTFAKLRAAVCARGGNAFSQAHWNRAPGASVADPPVELEANAWDEPR